jgi:hypothetical protein
MVVTWVVLAAADAGARLAAGGVLAGGVPVFRAGAVVFPGRFRLPVTLVFSLYVGQAGSARW